MNETWDEEPIGPKTYGSGSFGDFYFGSVHWTTSSKTDVTWSENTTDTTTWTEQ
tara:strand:- start:106 stop:267 length:162 start_codon:yes stop_codon:yes gene_type:complete